MGGGVFITAASPTIKRCTFTGNTATYGGGIYVLRGNPIIESCAFRGNASPGHRDTDTGLRPSRAVIE